MKVSVNWIKQLVDFELPPVDELVKKIGAQLGEVESVENLGEKYQGIIVAKVVECEKHPNADKLSLCKIDDGGRAQNVERDENGHVQVVCGAPNVREGLLVAWLPPGSTVPSSFGSDPFVLEARELRGETSNGMLASAKELAISDNHDGILEIDKDAKPGDDFALTYKLNDFVIEIENKMFTHRPDCFGGLGVARELAGILGHEFKNPDWYWQVPKFVAPAGLKIEISNDASEKVPRFMAVAVKNVEIKPSPVWLQVALAKIGQKPINNIVDITNFVMQLTAQPVHAYDYDKLRGAKLGARLAKKGEKVALLNHKTYELDEGDIVMVDAEGPVGLAGIMGGGDSEVRMTTKNIVLECASFDMYSVRRTGMRLGLFTDALTRFSKGQSPLQNDRVLAYLLKLIKDIAGGEQASEVFDFNDLGDKYERQSLNPALKVDPDFINRRLGLNLTSSDVEQLLRNVGFACSNDANGITITAPFWRTDIETAEDIVEEVGRLYGYDRLPQALPTRSIRPAPKNDLLELKKLLRAGLAKAGANEVLTYSFVHGNLLAKTGQDPKNAFRLANALSPDLQYYRLSLMPSLLDKVHSNIKAGYDRFALFELGKVHTKGQLDDEKLPREDELTALVVAVSEKSRPAGAAFFQAKKYLESMLKATLSYRTVSDKMREFDIMKPYDMDRTASVYAGDVFLGIVGEFRAEVRKNLKLPDYCAGFELDTAALAGLMTERIDYKEIPRYPKVEQDITLKVASDESYQDLADLLERGLTEQKPARTLANLTPLNIYQKSPGERTRQIAFRLEIASYDKTLLASEVNELLDRLAALAKEKLGAERI